MKLKSQLFGLWLLTHAASSTETECSQPTVLTPSYVLVTVGPCSYRGGHIADPIRSNTEKARKVDLFQIEGWPATTKLRVLTLPDNGLVVMSECEDYPRVSAGRIHKTDIEVIMSVCGLSPVCQVVYVTAAAFHLITDMLASRLLTSRIIMYSRLEELAVADFCYDLEDVGIPASGIEDSMKLVLPAGLESLSGVEYRVAAIKALHTYINGFCVDKMVKVNHRAAGKEVYWRERHDIKHARCVQEGSSLMGETQCPKQL